MPSLPLQEPEALYTAFDHFLGRWHARISGRYRVFIVLSVWIGYALIVLLFGRRLAVSSNYFVVVPVLVSAIAYGFSGGFIAGGLGLPANLLLFALLERPEFSPASKPIAELTGVILGSALGYLSDYYKKLERERSLRRESEGKLRQALHDRDILFKELHHRVKNNLHLVKSLINMQSRRSDDPGFKKAAAELSGRVMALSMVHEQLYKYSELSAVDIGKYLATLVRAIQQGAANPLYPPVLELDCAKRELPMDSVVPLGLIVNEALINAFKHNAQLERPLHLRLGFRMENERFILELSDDGDGLPDRQGVAPYAMAKGESLGLTLITLLAGQLGGSVAYRRSEGWTSFTLDFPADQNLALANNPA
ncbi:MAG TPA: hypothetical protein DCG47_04860 [Spirochaetaceae bacterium]|jgi:two-component sensor histidine kinase|nr:hypothetical protein [Spirochaetaceae bacterium]